ncbi:MAG: sulfatase-like hydrolase/transferase, partial [Desulfurococcales archaeon]|nr:sulfatase-like hydrolase/transferase [Desulfurococcales archaeon]
GKIREILERSFRFGDAYASINATDPSLTSMLTGFYPSSTGMVQHGHRVSADHLKLLSKVTFLQEILRSNGYRTIAVDFLDRWHSRGFHDYVNPRTSSAKAKLFRMLPASIKRMAAKRGPVRKAASIPYDAGEATRTAKRFIRRYSGRSYFMLLHYWDTHLPYNTDSYYVKIRKYGDLRVSDIARGLRGPWGNKLLEVFGDSLVDEVVSRYYSAGVYVHKIMDELLEEVDLDKTIIVITADHGESLGEHGIWFDHHGLYEVSLRVPLFIYLPGQEGGIRPGAYQHVDLTPTLLGLLKYRKVVDPLADGSDLSECILEGTGCPVSRVVFAEEWYVERKITIIDNKIKYIYAPDPREAQCRYCGVIHGGLRELYDLSEDPGETMSLARSRKELAEEMEAKLKNFVRRLLGKRVRLSLRSVPRL